jgi:putative peptidoglycan lipid II flippase
MAMGALLWLGTACFLPWAAADGHGVKQTAVLAILIVGGLAIYVALLLLLGVANWSEAMRAIKRPARDLRA